MLAALARLSPWLVVAALATAGAAALRFLLIEPGDWGARCAADAWADWCAVRSLTIEVFQQQRIGWLAAGAGLAGMALKSRPAAALAVVAGAVALTLYSVEPGAVGFLLGVVTLAAVPGRSGHSSASAPKATTSANDNAS